MFTQDQIKRFEARRRAEAQLSAPTQKPTGTTARGGTLTSLISEGGALGGAAIGAGIGSAVPIIGTAIGGAIGAGLGAFGGRLAENKVRDDRFDASSLKQAAGEGALSAVLSAPLKSVKYGATAAKASRGGATLTEALKTGAKAADSFTLRGAAGSRVTKKAEDLIAKEFRLNPTQQANYVKKHGVKATAVLKENGVKSSDDIGRVLPAYYDEFANISKQIPEFKTSEVVKSLEATYKPLVDSVLPTNKNLGQQLKAIADDIQARYPDVTPSDIVNSIRQEADGAVRYTLRGTSDEGVNRKTASTLRKLMQDTADKNGLKSSEGLTYKEVGRKISQLEDLAEITGKQEFLGTGSLPLSIPQLLGASAGGVAGGLPGGVAGIAATQIINSNAGRRATQAGVEKLGAKLTQGAAKGTGARGALTGAARGVTAQNLTNALDQPSLGNINDTTAPIDNMSMTDNTAAISDSLPQELPQAPTISREQALQAMAIDLAETGGKNFSKIQALYEFANPVNKSDEEKPLGTEAQKRALTSQSGLRSLQTLEETLAGDPGAFKRQALPNPFGITAGLTNTTDVRAATDNVVDVIARLRSGAAITDEEAARFARLLPQPGDSKESAARKLANVRAELESFMQPATNSDLEEALLQYGL